MIYQSTINSIYLDASSTTPLASNVLNRINDVYTKAWGNPSTIHQLGIYAAEELERSRQLISSLFNDKHSKVFFTSGATESVHLAILGATRNTSPGRIVISAVEHPSVIYAASLLCKKGWEVLEWPVNQFGQVDLDIIDKILQPPTSFVSVIWAQSEIGSIQPILEIGLACKRLNIPFHTDATQILSNYVPDLSKYNVDLLSASAHKFNGPKGVGLLVNTSNSKVKINKLQGGGNQELGVRSGTEAVPLISGMSLALQNIKFDTSINRDDSKIKMVKDLTDLLRRDLSLINNIDFTGHPQKRLSNHISMIVKDKSDSPILGTELVRRLSQKGVYASSSTACHSGLLDESHVLKALGISSRLCKSGLRFTLGSWLTKDLINTVPSILEECISSFSKN